MNTLSPEIILNIYNYLDINTLLRLRKINKQHKEIIRIHFFNRILKNNKSWFKYNSFNHIQSSLLIHLYCIVITCKEIIKVTFGRCIIHIVRTQINKGTFKISKSPKFAFKYARYCYDDINYNILLYNNEDFTAIGDIVSKLSLDITIKVWNDDNMMTIYIF